MHSWLPTHAADVIIKLYHCRGNYEIKKYSTNAQMTKQTISVALVGKSGTQK